MIKLTEKEIENLTDFEVWDYSIALRKDRDFDKMTAITQPSVDEVFDVMDSYKRYCIKFGRPYNEQNLFDNGSKVWLDYKLVIDKENKIKVQNHWNRDLYRKQQGTLPSIS